MTSFERLLQRPLAVALILALALPFVPEAASAQQSGAQPQQSTPSQPQQTAPAQQQGGTPSVAPPLPSPNSQSQAAPVTTAPAPSSMQPPPEAPQPVQPSTSAPPAPVGTAAAPYEKGIGVAASRPAGVVIAPAKQRRTRSFLIRTGLIIGAAVAVGTVVALSNASPSQPH
jgi:hypothetical protein